jgi:hypothetical protein
MAAAAESTIETVHIDKKMRHTLSEEGCPICLTPFDELGGVGIFIQPGCQHPVCITCVAKDQAQNKKMQCSVCKTEHEVSVKLPIADTLAQPQALNLSVDVWYLDETLSVFLQICERNTDQGQLICVESLSPILQFDEPYNAFFPGSRRRFERTEFGNSRPVPLCLKIFVGDLMCNCMEDDCDECNDRSQREQYHLPCILTVKDDQMTFTFPNNQASNRAPRILPVTLDSVATITVPRISG